MRLLLLLLALSSCVPDADHDGVIRVACVGDSMTVATAWCEYAQALAPTHVWMNYGVSGATAVASSLPQLQVTAALAAHADAVILAAGTNDSFLAHASAAEYVAAIQALCAQVSATGAACLPALVPPGAFADATGYNAALHAAFPVTIDFNAGMTLGPDGYHVDDVSQHVRAARAVEMTR